MAAKKLPKKKVRRMSAESDARDAEDKLANTTATIADQSKLHDVCWYCSQPTCQIHCMVEIDRRLVAAGWEPISEKWWDAIRRSRGVRNVVIRGGRRSRKSTVACVKAVSEVLNPDHQLPPAAVAYFGIISAKKEQALELIRVCAKILSILEVPHKALTEVITLNERNSGIKAFVATLKGVVSFTALGLLLDEMARWQDPDTGANPASEVLTSLKPTMLTMRLAQAWYVSSPWSTLDVHHKMFEDGDTEDQRVFSGATWEWNTTITEADTHAMERDYVSWAREYAAIPMSSDETKFFAGAFIEAARSVIATGITEVCRGGGDWGFRRNWSAVVAMEKRGDKMRVTMCEYRAPGKEPLRPSATMTELVGLAVSHGTEAIACDIHYVDSAREVMEDFSIPLLEFPNDADGIAKAYIRTRVLLADGMIDLSSAPALLLEQMKETTGKPTDAGGLQIRNPIKGGSHGDLVSAFVCAVWAMDQQVESRPIPIGGKRFARETHSTLKDSAADSMPSGKWMD